MTYFVIPDQPVSLAMAISLTLVWAASLTLSLRLIAGSHRTDVIDRALSQLFSRQGGMAPGWVLPLRRWVAAFLVIESLVNLRLVAVSWSLFGSGTGQWWGVSIYAAEALVIVALRLSLYEIDRVERQAVDREVHPVAS